MTATTETTSAQPLTAEELRLLDAYWRAANYLSVGPGLPARQPAAARAPATRAHQAAAPGPLRDDARPQSDLRPHEPGDPSARSERDLRDRPWVTAGRRSSPTPTSRAPTPSATRTPPRTKPGSGRSSASSHSPAGSRATSRRRCRARFTRAASWAMPSSTRSARRSTTPTWSSRASWATARPRRAARRQLALEQVPERQDRRCRASDPAPERLQDREPDHPCPDPGGRARRALPRVRLGAAARRGRRARAGASGLRGRARPVARPDRGDPARSATRARRPDRPGR